MKKRLLVSLVVLTGMFLLTASIVWAQGAPVAKTGQTTSYAAGDDGDLQKGVAWPIPRFTDNGDQTVTDNLTGLMWAKDANLASGSNDWLVAINYANSLSLGNAGCGSSYTDWRLPNRFELESLLDLGNYNPALPSGHPFLNVQNHYYWTSTTYAPSSEYAWFVLMSSGTVNYVTKPDELHVWPVRGGN
jgi:hypothetical protein